MSLCSTFPFDVPTEWCVRHLCQWRAPLAFWKIDLPDSLSCRSRRNIQKRLSIWMPQFLEHTSDALLRPRNVSSKETSLPSRISYCTPLGYVRVPEQQFPYASQRFCNAAFWLILNSLEVYFAFGLRRFDIGVYGGRWFSCDVFFSMVWLDILFNMLGFSSEDLRT